MSLPQSNTFNNLGGELQDFAPSSDAQTDLPAVADDEARCDVAAMTRMIGRCYATFGNDLVVVEHDSVWGNDVSVKPVATHPGTGHYTLTWPSTVTDARAIAHALNLRRGAACCEDAGYSASAIRTGPTTVDVFITRISTGAATNLPGLANVWGW